MISIKSTVIAPLGLILSIAFFSLFLHESRASTTGVNSLGFLIGETFANSNSNLTFGGEWTYAMYPPFGVGTSLTRYAYDTGLGYSNGLTTLTFKGFTQLYDFLEGLTVGGQLGLGFYTTGSPTLSGTTSLILGPSVSYDYLIGDQISVGLEGTYYLTTASNTSSFLQALIAIRFWI